MSKARCCNSVHQEELFENPWMLSCRSSQVILRTYVECRGWDNKGLRSTVWATSWESPSIERITAAFWRGWHISDHRYSSPFHCPPKASLQRLRCSCIHGSDSKLAELRFLEADFVSCCGPDRCMPSYLYVCIYIISSRVLILNPIDILGWEILSSRG